MSDNHFRGKHSEYSLHFHIVFVTKYRKKIFAERHLVRMREMFAALAADAGASLAEFNGEADHVHLLLHATPSTPGVAKLVNIDLSYLPDQ